MCPLVFSEFKLEEKSQSSIWALAIEPENGAYLPSELLLVAQSDLAQKRGTEASGILTAVKFDGRFKCP
jgi:hypothetical protein